MDQRYITVTRMLVTIEDNAAAIAKVVDTALSENNCEKVNIIAHSKGGLDCRYLITSMGYANKVASLTTINTPHRIRTDYIT